MFPQSDLPAIIRQLEEHLLQPRIRKSVSEISSLLAEEFFEFGSSGRVFNKQQVIAALQDEPEMRFVLTEFNTALIAPGVILATYRATRYSSKGEQPVVSLRSSIWKWIDDRWQMVFHQGTPAGE